MKKGMLVLAMIVGCTIIVQGQSRPFRCRPCALNSLLDKWGKMNKITVIRDRELVKRLGEPVYTDSLPKDPQAAMQIVFKKQHYLGYYLNQYRELFVFDKSRQDSSGPAPFKYIILRARGKVIDAEGNAMAGTSIQRKGTGTGVKADSLGYFSLRGRRGDVLVFSCVDCKPKEIILKDSSPITVTLEHEPTSYDPAVVNGYTTLNPVENTASISRISIDQPVNSTVLESTRGQVAGMTVTPTSGVPGASEEVSIRGNNSIGQTPGWNNRPANNPLIIIDGVPMPTLLQPINQFPSMVGDPKGTGISGKGLNPLYTVNPGDIESIQVLKDAAATAIYGARGANGVIVIRTRKARWGKPVLTCSSFIGIGRITTAMDMMNTRQYLDMRYEAFANDTINWRLPNIPAGDLKIMDTTQDTDFKKWLLGGTAKITDYHIAFSEGKKRFRYFLSGSYHKETTVLPGDIYGRRIAATGDFLYKLSPKITIGFTGLTSGTQNNWTPFNPMYGMLLVPMAPPLVKNGDSLNWGSPNAYFLNPLSYFRNKLLINTTNTLLHAHGIYRIGKGWKAEVSAGYNSLVTREEARYPISAKNPAIPGVTGEFSTAVNRYETWNIEPQIQYTYYNARHDLTVQTVLGGSWLSLKNNSSTEDYNGYTRDDLLGKPDAYTDYKSTSDKSIYRYLSAFSQVNLELQKRYLLSLTYRMDESSRFGAKHRLARLGSVGAGWVIRDIDTAVQTKSTLSYVKLRGSIGLTGNDQIGDYQYLNGYTYYTGGQLYQGLPALMATSLSNPYYQWEFTRKLELALETSLFNKSLSVTVMYYRNRSSNLLINNQLPAQTGFGAIATNVDALVQNSGLELEATLYKKWGPVTYDAKLTLARPWNKLLRFPGLEQSVYAGTLVVGQSLTAERIPAFTGVNPQTGLFTATKDSIIAGNHDPKLVGGFIQTIGLGNWQLQTAWEWRIQRAPYYLLYTYKNLAPGRKADTYFMNQPAALANHWQKPGDQAPWQKFSTKGTSAINSAINNWTNSDGQLVNGSYLLLKNIRLSYELTKHFMKRWGIQKAGLFVNGENLFTITPYKGADPQVANPLVLPPLKVLTLGITLTL